jgi:hypothetical protein
MDQVQVSTKYQLQDIQAFLILFLYLIYLSTVTLRKVPFLFASHHAAGQSTARSLIFISAGNFVAVSGTSANVT